MTFEEFCEQSDIALRVPSNIELCKKVWSESVRIERDRCLGILKKIALECDSDDFALDIINDAIDRVRDLQTKGK